MLVVVALAYGTVGYVAIEKWPLLDAPYMTITTIATVSYGEVRPLSDVGRLLAGAKTLKVGSRRARKVINRVLAEGVRRGLFVVDENWTAAWAVPSTK